MTSDTDFPSRRSLLATGGAFALIAALPGRAAAQPAQRAQALVTELSREILALINSGRPEGQLYGEFEHVLARYGDMPAIAARTLGPAWRTTSPDRQRAFVAAFQAYLARRYGRQFRDFQQASIAIQRVQDAGDAGVVVETRLSRPGRADLNVAWQISERSGNPRVVNIIIEGVSMIANERAEIAALLEAQRGSVDGLIQALRARS